MKKLLLPLLLAACAADEPIEYEYIPVDPSTVSIFEFKMSGFSGDSFEYAFDNRAETFSGFRVVDERCRALVADPVELDPTKLRELLAGHIAVLDEAECARAQDEETIIHGDFMSVTLDGEHLSGYPGSCKDLVPRGDVQAELHGILAHHSPVIENVRWAGNKYEAVESDSPRLQCRELQLDERLQRP